MLQQYAGMKVTVMGLGLFGGGVAVAKFLSQQGADVIVTDVRTEEELAESIAVLEDLGNIRFRLGSHDEHDFLDADLVVANPAVRPQSAFLELARQHGIPITTELGIFIEHNPGRVIAITGSNGKSTTVAMIYHLLESHRIRAHLGGNIGRSLLEDLENIEEDDWVVLEVSSFQLWHLSRLRFSPEIAVVTNFSPNHLDWHSSIEDYRLAKQCILEFQTKDQAAVLNNDDPDVRQWKGDARRVYFSQIDAEVNELMVTDNVSLPKHYAANAAAAIAACEVIGIPKESSIQALESFRGLPHRMQVVGEHHGRIFINDSAATTPESTMMALDGAKESTILIFGGASKGLPMRQVAEAINRTCKAVVLYGGTGTLLESELRSLNQSRSVKVSSSMPTAFKAAVDLSQAGDTILFSPGSTSYGDFRNFHERGVRFQELVNQYSRETQIDEG